ncbi:MAG: 50S ribosomal protein L29 [Saprospiraceae bacterium]|jgi:large subunit ribosomal protein L29|nr:50S ribosomal protein L29 [Saprospiraceae bacterium]
MATNKYQELVKFSDEDLATELQVTQREYQRMQFDQALKGLESPIKLREIRRDIARIKTEVRRRELSGLSNADIASRDKIVQRRRKS